MEVKEWTYEEFPEFTEKIDGVGIIETTGDELGVRYLHDIEYAHLNGVSLHIQLLTPYTRKQPRYPLVPGMSTAPNTQIKSESLLPCIVFIQGSAWMKQNVYMQLPMMANLAKKGYIVACVEYRDSGIAQFPAQAIDAGNAIRFLKLHANEFFIDQERMIVAGDSSGGHTAMFVGIRKNDETDENLYPGISSSVKGIINYYGSVSVMMEDGNPSTINHHLPDSPEGMVMGGVNLRERPDLCKQLSVECNITQDTEIAPVLIFHGTKDRIVNTRQSITLYNKLKETGKQVELYLIRGGDHGGPEFWTDEVIHIIHKFIQNCFNK